MDVLLGESRDHISPRAQARGVGETGAGREAAAEGKAERAWREGTAEGGAERAWREGTAEGEAERAWREGTAEGEAERAGREGTAEGEAERAWREETRAPGKTVTSKWRQIHISILSLLTFSVDWCSFCCFDGFRENNAKVAAEAELQLKQELSASQDLVKRKEDELVKYKQQVSTTRPRQVPYTNAQIPVEPRLTVARYCGHVVVTATFLFPFKIPISVVGR